MSFSGSLRSSHPNPPSIMSPPLVTVITKNNDNCHTHQRHQIIKIMHFSSHLCHHRCCCCSRCLCNNVDTPSLSPFFSHCHHFSPVMFHPHYNLCHFYIRLTPIVCSLFIIGLELGECWARFLGWWVIIKLVIYGPIQLYY